MCQLSSSTSGRTAFFPEDESFRNSFSDKEVGALERFDNVLNRVCDETPQELPSLEEFVETDEWKQLSAAASVALAAISQ